MSDNDQKQFDLDTLTDDEVMKLDPSQVQAFMSGEAVYNANANADDVSDTGDEPVTPTEPSEPATTQEDPVQGQDPFKTGTVQPEPVQKQESVKQEPAKPAAPQADTDKNKKPVEAAAPAVDANVALDFYTKVSAPFKADGKDIQVRSPEDAIRLMQMGVNYSRRMQEMKPMRAIDSMLKAHGLNDPEKLSFLIDVSKGKPDAIQKLLKDTKIDPIDLDVTKDTGYKAPNYQPNVKDQTFQDAIDQTLASEGGTELIKDIHSGWDVVSKEALRDEPAIFENLLAQKRSGVYGKIKTELEYQRTMGFLTDVPFLQAYHQVGDAMQKAGVFGKPKEPQVQSTGVIAPIDTGTRKAATAPKTEQPNPNLSSATQPRVAPSNGGNQNNAPDYSMMSDADFLKLAPPR